MSNSPQPGTVAYQNPEPDLVTEALALVRDGTGRPEAVSRLRAGNPPRHEVEAAHTHWVRQLRRFPWDDYTGTLVLMVLEDVMRETPQGT